MNSFMLTLRLIVIFLTPILVGFTACEFQKVGDCDEGKDECDELRVTEMPGNKKSYALDDISIAVPGSMFGKATIKIAHYDEATVQTCGASLISKAFRFTAETDEGFVELEDLDKKWVEVRHNSSELFPDRSDISVVIQRGSDEGFTLTSEGYYPQGETAKDETQFIFYAQESNAVMYIVQGELDETCSAYPIAPDEEPDAFKG